MATGSWRQLGATVFDFLPPLASALDGGLRITGVIAAAWVSIIGGVAYIAIFGSATKSKRARAVLKLLLRKTPRPPRRYD